MGHSQTEKAESRERILDAAARQIRESGLDSISIAQLMQEANLTHGGFYVHFKSRADLIRAAVERAIEDGMRNSAASTSKTKTSSSAPQTPRSPIKSFLNSYLSPAHRDDASGGCAFATLASEVGRSNDPELRKIMGARMNRLFAGMAKAMGGGRRGDAAALAAWSTMIGAVTLARLFDEPRSDEILKAARQSILDLADGLTDET